MNHNTTSLFNQLPHFFLVPVPELERFIKGEAVLQIGYLLVEQTADKVHELRNEPGLFFNGKYRTDCIIGDPEGKPQYSAILSAPIASTFSKFIREKVRHLDSDERIAPVYIDESQPIDSN